MPIFKATNGNWFTRQLFYETTLSDKSNVLYTLKGEDYLGYPSLYRLYIDIADPTEYEFVKAALGGWEHWEALLDTQWFKEYITAWRRELDVKIKSTALAKLFKAAESPDAKISVSVNRFLLEKDLTPGPKASRGRPSKAEIKKAANEIADFETRLSEDYQRLKAN